MGIGWRLAAVSALLIGISGSAHAQDRKKPADFKATDIALVEKDAPHPDSNRVTEVVFLSEGYTDDARDDFFKAAKSLAHQLTSDKASEPMRQVTDFNFYYVFVPSTDKGAPWRSGEAPGDTPFEAHVGKDGGLATNDAAVDRAVAAVGSLENLKVSVVVINLLSKRADKPGPRVTKKSPTTGPTDVRDISDTPEDTYVLLDHCKRGKSQHKGAEVGRVRQIAIDARAFIHEFGHARFGLDDEYSETGTGAIEKDEDKAALAQFPNCTTDPSGERFRRYVPELFANGAHPKLFEGGDGSFEKGVWRCDSTCRMRASRTEPFCRVCTAIILGTKNPMEQPSAPEWVSPSGGKAAVSPGKLLARWKSASTPESFHLELLAPGHKKPVWKTDVEGHLRDVPIAFSKAGTYTLTIQSMTNMAAVPGGKSVLVSTELRIGASGEEATTPGLTGRVRKTGE